MANYNDKSFVIRLHQSCIIEHNSACGSGHIFYIAAPKDYESVNTEMVFEGGLTRVCTSIIIYDDNTVELSDSRNAEKFTISLESRHRGVEHTAVISRENIYIIDNDGMFLCVREGVAI